MARFSTIACLLGLLGLDALRAVPATALEREYLVHVWKTDDGLPQNWVSSIAQTPDGYLWIGTRYGGLARFDGVRFVSYGPQNTRALQDVQVEHLSVDVRGRLWVVMGNESITSVEQGRFTLRRLPRAEPRLRADHVLVTTAEDVLFAGEHDNLAELHLPDNRWARIDLRPVIQPDARTFVADAVGTVWYVTQQQQLARWRLGRGELVPRFGEPVVGVATAGSVLWVATTHHLFARRGEEGFVDCTPQDGAPPAEILQLTACADGALWVLETQRLRKFQDGRWVAEAAAREFQRGTNLTALALHGDAAGDLWAISTGRGMWHVKSDGSVSELTEKTGLPSLFITCWFQDAERNIWIGTGGGGIARIRESHFHAFGQRVGLPGTVVNSVCVDDAGDLWAGTMSGGLARLHDGKYTAIPLPAAEGATPTSVTVVPARDGGLWVGSINQGLLRWRAGGFTRSPSPWDTIRVLYEDRGGRLWVGGLVDLCCVDQGRITEFGRADGFADRHAIGALAEDAAGALWIGTGPGDLWKYAAGKFTRFTPPAEWPSVRFSAVLPDKDGVVWVGTLGGGLLRFQGGRFTRCTRTNGLPDDNIAQLLDSDDGHLWAGTYAGIFRADKVDLENVGAGRSPRVPVQVYGRFDGLPALECSSGFQPACWRSADGRLCFSTSNGAVMVNPREVTENKVAPRVVIEEMLVDGKPIELGPGPAGNAAPPMSGEIGPGKHYVQFRFTGLSFAAPDGVRFRVKLVGAEREWQSIGGERQIGYGPLSPGDYRLEALACNNDGVWSTTGAALAFRVLPQFWETWWFKLCVAGFALGALAATVGVIVRRRFRQRLQHVEQQRELERERARIARDLHDDLGTSLTQISMLSALANREQTTPSEARELVEMVHGRARAMVTALDEIVWAVNPKNDTWAELASYLGHFAEEFFRPTAIRCRLDIPVQLPAYSLSAEFRHELFLAFKEALNNAARHSGATHVYVRIQTMADEAIVAIEDDGRGMDLRQRSSARTGNGLSNMQRRLQHLGGRCEIQSEAGAGTRIAFRVPLLRRAVAGVT